MQKAGTSLKPLEETKITITVSDTSSQQSDLLGLTGISEPMTEYNAASINTGIEDTVIKTELSREAAYFVSNSGTEKMMMIRDSFGIAMAPIIAPYFSQSYIVHRRMFKNEMLDREMTNILIFETVERHLPELMSFDITRNKVCSAK